MEQPQIKRTTTKLMVLGLLLAFVSCTSSSKFDILILNGQVYDGSGSGPVKADVGIRDSIIVAVGNLARSEATRTIDAKGMAVTPGFIDMHAHLDPILKLSDCESHVRQGVTTALGGPDGGSPWPIKAHLDSLEQLGVGMNVAYLAGHNQIRENIMALDNRAPTPEELEQMKEQVDQAMDEGAYGLSTGLKYLPGAFSKVDEVIELSKVASAKGGIYTSHLRDEGLGLFDAVREAIQISEKAEIPVILTHHKVIGKPMWGKSTVTLAMVDSARAAGLDIKLDQYPYNASHTGISVLIPGWARAGGNEAFIKRVQDPKLKDSIKAGIIFNILNDRGGKDLKRIQFAKVKWNKDLEGKTLEHWCVSRGFEPTVENGAELVIEAQVNGGASCIYHAMHEEDVERIMKHPQTMIASDGRLVRPDQGHPHPRWYGTFPRVLGHYVREKSIISLPEAIYKMTKLPASSLGLTDRGELKEGMRGDIVIFDPATIIDKATFEDPHHYSEGIHFVLVNGQVVIDETNFNGTKAGKVLRKNAP